MAQLGLQQNWRQFSLLVIVNGFVGGMIGIERTIFPQFAAQEFGIASNTSILSFIVAFGIAKAIANYYTGRLANQYGRRRLLIAGWWIALPIPFMLMYAPSWNWVVVANVLLGISQGLTWSSTVVMKIDLVGEKDRGFAMGLNEFAGYFAVGITAFLSGFIANKYGVTPYPFYVGIVIAVAGLLLSIFWVKDTTTFVQQESSNNKIIPLRNVFMATTFSHKTLSSVTQAGLINNLNDGMIWGLLPIILVSLHFNQEQMGIITAIYPTVWGISQLFTGKMSDHYSKKAMLFWGMLLQGIAIIFIPFTSSLYILAGLSFVLGFGTALVYPTFLSTIAQATTPQQRAESIGTFRLWRDLGYAIGAVISGIIADAIGIEYAVFFIGGLTVFSALVIQFRMPSAKSNIKTCIEPVAVKQALAMHQKIQLIDVRTRDEFEQSHIPEAIHIALPQLTTHIAQMDRSYRYITVCAKGGGRSADGAKLLAEKGFDANWLCGGTLGWLNM